MPRSENNEVAPFIEPDAQMTLEGFAPAGLVDLTNDKPLPGRMANQTWRILEEQRMAAEETIAECEAEIERWTAKLDDALRAKAVCNAGQAVLDGRS